MPTYQYRCDACGVDFEVVQSFSDDSVPKCPNRPKACTSRGTSKIRKIFSAPGITFKGSGFYKTDTRSKPKAKSSGGESSGSEKPESSTSSESKSDSKSASKSEGSKSESKPAKKDSATTGSGS